MIYIFDIDGTIADCTHRLHFITNTQGAKDWSGFFQACDQDKPIYEVIDALRALESAGHPILIVSGRSDEVQTKTKLWLNKHHIYYCGLYMRKAGDHREDSIVKAEIFENQIVKEWNRDEIAGVFEDRQQVVDMYRARGLRVFQVAEGKF